MTRGTAIAVGRARRVINMPLREINLRPLLDSLISFPRVLSHMQINVAVSEIQRLEHRATRSNIDFVVKSMNVHRFRKRVHCCLLIIWTNNLAANNLTFSGRVLTFESAKSDFRVFSRIRPPEINVGEVETHSVCVG